MTISLTPIGVIQTPFNKVSDMPIQPLSGKGIKGRIVLHEDYLDGLKDIDGFSHIILLYHLHLISHYALTVVPFMDTEEHGIFATRSPKRPNRIGLSIVRLIGVNRNILEIEDLDMVNNSPLIDIKPFFPQFDNREDGKAGWLDKNQNLRDKEQFRSDSRFGQ